jgi:hypothetical protein
VGLLAVACSSRPGLLLDSQFGGSQPDGGAGDGGGSLGSLTLDGGGFVPACPANPDDAGGVCGCLDLSLLSNQPNLYFVLDRSGSMNENDKWDTIRTVVAQVMTALGPRARFGVAAFPDPRGSDACAQGFELIPPTVGDAPAGQQGQLTTTFLEVTNSPPFGGTPTAATLSALAPGLQALTGKTYVILATDGGPNCDANTSCDVSACIPNIESSAPGCTPNAPPNCCASEPQNCLDTGPSVAAVQALASAGIPTYVIGVPGSGPYGGVLDQMAIAGGTARAAEPYYYAVDTTDQTAFAAALSSIAAKITASCTLQLSAAPPDPSRVNVYLDGAVVPQDPTNGWTLSGSTVTLVGDTCNRVMTGSALSLRIVAGCPTVIK